MNSQEFNRIVDEQFVMCARLLGLKDKEYSTEDDRLHNFKIAAALKGESPLQAAAGMMVKHTVSIFDMLMSDVDYPDYVWQEKITDHINYLLLVKALVQEEKGEDRQMKIEYPVGVFSSSKNMEKFWAQIEDQNIKNQAKREG